MVPPGSLGAKGIQDLFEERGCAQPKVWPVIEGDKFSFFVLADGPSANSLVHEKFYNGFQIMPVVERDRYWQTSLTQAQHEVARLQCENHQLRQQFGMQERGAAFHCQRVHGQLSKLAHDTHVLGADFEKSRQHHAKEMKTASATLKKAQEQLAEAQRSLSCEKNKLVAVNAELADAKKTIASLEQKLTVSRQNDADAASKIRKVNAARKKTERALRAASEEKDRLLVRVSQLTDSLSQSERRSADALALREESLRERLREQTELVTMCGEDCMLQQDRCVTQDEKIADLRAENGDLLERNEKLAKRLRIWEQSVSPKFRPASPAEPEAPAAFVVSELPSSPVRKKKKRRKRNKKKKKKQQQRHGDIIEPIHLSGDDSGEFDPMFELECMRSKAESYEELRAMREREREIFDIVLNLLRGLGVPKAVVDNLASDAAAATSVRKKVAKLDVAKQLRKVLGRMTPEMLAELEIDVKHASVINTPKIIEVFWSKHTTLLADNERLARALKQHGAMTTYPTVSLSVGVCLFPKEKPVPRITDIDADVGCRLKDLTQKQVNQIVQETLCEELLDDEGTSSMYVDRVLKSHQGLGIVQLTGTVRNVLKQIASDEANGKFIPEQYRDKEGATQKTLKWTWASLRLAIQVRLRIDTNIMARRILHCSVWSDACPEGYSRYMTGDVIMSIQAAMSRIFHDHVRPHDLLDVFGAHDQLVDFVTDYQDAIRGFDCWGEAGPAFGPIIDPTMIRFIVADMGRAKVQALMENILDDTTPASSDDHRREVSERQRACDLALKASESDTDRISWCGIFIHRIKDTLQRLAKFIAERQVAKTDFMITVDRRKKTTAMKEVGSSRRAAERQLEKDLRDLGHSRAVEMVASAKAMVDDPLEFLARPYVLDRDFILVSSTLYLMEKVACSERAPIKPIISKLCSGIEVEKKDIVEKYVTWIQKNALEAIQQKHPLRAFKEKVPHFQSLTNDTREMKKAIIALTRNMRDKDAQRRLHAALTKLRQNELYVEKEMPNVVAAINFHPMVKYKIEMEAAIAALKGDLRDIAARRKLQSAIDILEKNELYVEEEMPEVAGAKRLLKAITNVVRREKHKKARAVFAQCEQDIRKDAAVKLQARARGMSTRKQKQSLSDASSL